VSAASRCGTLLGLLAALAFASCGGRAPGGHVLRIADLANPSSLNPLLAHDQETIGDDLLFVQTLTAIDAHNRVVPQLIVRIPTKQNDGISADGLRITYHLRHGVRFADGVELTSKDVAFTYRAILDPRNPVLSQDAYRRIASLTTPDRYTVEIRLKRPWNAAVSDLFAESDFAFGILPAHAFHGTLLQSADWENHAFGTGPFRVARWLRGDRIELVPNPYYSPRPRLRRIDLRVIHDDNTAFIALRTHEVDVASLETPQLVAQAQTLGDLRIQRTPLNGTVWLTIQSTTPPGENPAFRRAVAAALDMGSLEKTYSGLYPPAASFLPPVMTPWYDPSIRPYGFDPARARALLGGKHVQGVLVLVSEQPLWIRMATAIQQELAAANIDVSIKLFPTELFNAPDGPVRNAHFTLSIDGWLGGADPEQSIVFTCAQANVDGDNIARYCNPQFERLFRDQSQTPSQAARIADFRAMQRLIHDGLPVIPLYYLTWYDGVGANVRGFARNMLEYPVSPERWDVSGSP
jgi:peptide/nickel transport system substrate-binding protein